MKLNQNDKFIFDVSIFIHSNHYIGLKNGFEYTTQELSDKVLNNIANIVMRLDLMPNQVYLAFDSNGTYFRYDLLPTYKSGRKDLPYAFDLIYDFLSSMYSSFKIKGLEADDLIFLFSRNNKSRTFIVSTDNDFKLMLVKDKVLQYNHMQDIYVNLFKEDVLLEQLLKITGGCKSDTIPSIKLKRFGVAYLTKLIKSNPKSTLKELLDMLVIDGRLDDWSLNYNLVMYDLDVYRNLNLSNVAE